MTRQIFCKTKKKIIKKSVLALNGVDKKESNHNIHYYNLILHVFEVSQQPSS